MSRGIGRRAWIERACVLTAGVLVGAFVRGRNEEPSSPTVYGPEAVPPEQPSTALSLAELQRRARAARDAGTELPSEIAELGGLNRIGGLTALGDDVILFGDRDPNAPPIHFDDAMVSFRSAYQTDALYRDSPGCTIDPRDAEADPWAIQDVRVLGMPRCQMAGRHVALDYELKFVGAGMLRLDGVRSSFDDAAVEAMCDMGESPVRDSQNRFWFASRYPADESRFDADEATVIIRRPIDVQVLTERHLHAGGGDGSDPEAEAFARSVTELLAAGTRREYVALRNDFRIIEVGRLCRYREVPPAVFDYLLEEHDHRPVDVPSLVIGVTRTDVTNLVCGGTVEATKRGVTGRMQTRHLEQRYRGGVDAAVTISPQHIEMAGGRFAGLRARIQRARPSANSLVWPVPPQGRNLST